MLQCVSSIELSLIVFVFRVLSLRVVSYASVHNAIQSWSAMCLSQMNVEC